MFKLQSLTAAVTGNLEAAASLLGSILFAEDFSFVNFSAVDIHQLFP
jgi:hypothetical protein